METIPEAPEFETGTTGDRVNKKVEKHSVFCDASTLDLSGEQMGRASRPPSDRAL